VARKRTFFGGGGGKEGCKEKEKGKKAQPLKRDGASDRGKGKKKRKFYLPLTKESAKPRKGKGAEG